MNEKHIISPTLKVWNELCLFTEYQLSVAVHSENAHSGELIERSLLQKNTLEKITLPHPPLPE